jgi:hypothetical protein
MVPENTPGKMNNAKNTPAPNQMAALTMPTNLKIPLTPEA